MALFFYGIFPEAEARFVNGKIQMHHIATWRNVLKIAREQKLFDDERSGFGRRIPERAGQVVCGPWRRRANCRPPDFIRI